MKKVHHLTKADDFRALFKKGKRLESPLFFLLVGRNKIACARFAFITPRAIEKRAVKRNLLRRRAREWFRTRSGLLKDPLDITLTFKKTAVGIPRTKMYEELERITRAIKNL